MRGKDFFRLQWTSQVLREYRIHIDRGWHKGVVAPIQRDFPPSPSVFSCGASGQRRPIALKHRKRRLAVLRSGPLEALETSSIYHCWIPLPLKGQNMSHFAIHSFDSVFNFSFLKWQSCTIWRLACIGGLEGKKQ